MVDSKLQAEMVRESFEPLADYYARSKAHTDRDSLERLRMLVETGPAKTVLDVATGPGHTAMHLAPHVGRVVGLDLTRPMLLKAAELSSSRSIGNLDLVQGNVYSLPFGDETFDIVTCRRAPHHFPDLLGAVRSMKRVIKRGGVMVIDDRSVPEDDFTDRTMNELDVLHDRSHVRDYRPSEWRSVMGEAGLIVEGLETFSRVWPLSSLTDTAALEDRTEIERRVRSLDDAERKRMGVCEIEGVLQIRHWYVVVKARRL
ncbi:MAG: methyltransferase domain-containing protein [Methanomassiliicoccales archaeon]|nr:methyltransferase domain-containing protein [Methanomassiliicoccales archaeon]